MNETLRAVLEKTLDAELATLEKETDWRESEYWDSLRYVALVVSLESEFKVKLSKNDIRQLSCVESVKGVLRRHGIAV